MRAHTAKKVATLAMTDASVAKLNDAVASGGYWNADLAPVPPSARRWGLKDVAALWVALAACIPTYMLASALGVDPGGHYTDPGGRPFPISTGKPVRTLYG